MPIQGRGHFGLAGHRCLPQAPSPLLFPPWWLLDPSPSTSPGPIRQVCPVSAEGRVTGAGGQGGGLRARQEPALPLSPALRHQTGCFIPGPRCPSSVTWCRVHTELSDDAGPRPSMEQTAPPSVHPAHTSPEPSGLKEQPRMCSRFSWARDLDGAGRVLLSRTAQQGLVQLPQRVSG